MDQLVEIRCPNIVVKKKRGEQREEVCNKLCVKVAPGSQGEAHCMGCDNRFSFDVARDNHSVYDILRNREAVTPE